MELRDSGWQSKENRNPYWLKRQSSELRPLSAVKRENARKIEKERAGAETARQDKTGMDW